MFATNGTLLAETDDFELVDADAHIREEFLGGNGPLVTESDVVLVRAAFVGVAFDFDLLAGVALHDVPNDRDVTFQGFGGVGANGRLVVIEQDVLKLGERLV